MAKVANPVRGYVTCPTCNLAATVHQVGEGKLMSLGEPPKNARNLGLLYYRCPECGNSATSKSVSEYVEKRMKASADALEISEIGDKVTENEAVEPSALTVTEAVMPERDEASKDKALSAGVTEPCPAAKVPFFSRKRIVMLLSALIIVVWVCRKLTRKAEPEQPEAEAA